MEDIVTTGSRLKRDTVNSISPLQVITGQMSHEIGLIDPGKILQESTAATGQRRRRATSPDLVDTSCWRSLAGSGVYRSLGFNT